MTIDTAWNDQRRLEYLERISIREWDDDDKRFVFAHFQAVRDRVAELERGLNEIARMVAEPPV